MQRPGLEERMRKKSAPTSVPGVQKVGPNLFRVRAKVTDPKTGRTKEIDREVEASRPSEAAAIRERLRKEALDPGASAPTKRPRVGELALSWLSGKLSELKPSTRKHYASVIDLHIVPGLGDVYLDALTASDVIEWRDAMEGRPPSVNSRLRVLKTILADVTHERGIHNPAARVSRVREPKRREARAVKITELPRCPANRLTAEELAAVLAQLRTRSPQWYPLILTLAVTGARWGEATALRWPHVDTRAGVLRIEDAHWRGHVDDTKTGAIKTLPLPDLLGQVLLEHRRELVAAQHEGLAAGWVFPSEVGKPHADPSCIRTPLARALEDAKIGRWVSPHGLRRSFNNLVRQVAAGEVVRAMTGHSTEEMTEHYSHVELTEKRAAIHTALRLVVGEAPATGGDGGGDRPGGTKKPG